MQENAGGGTYTFSCYAIFLLGQIQLRSFIAHLEVIGGEKDVISNADLVRKQLSDLVQCFEKIVGATEEGTWNLAFDLINLVTVNVSLGRRLAISNMEQFSLKLHSYILKFERSGHHENEPYATKLYQWRRCTNVSTVSYLVMELIRLCEGYVA